MVSFSERLKEERLKLDLNQTDFGDLGGVTKKTQMLYEAGERSPDARYLQLVAAAGVDVQYVLTGIRSYQTVERPTLSDRERLVLAVEAVVEGLEEARRKLPADKLAELILVAYDLMADPVQTKDNVIQLVRKVA